ncbi:MAG: ubiquinone biosynthesis protein UbiB, partial [Aurantimonas coralicida]
MANPVTGTLALIRAVYVLAREGVVGSFPGEGLPPGPALLHRFARLIDRGSAENRPRSDPLSRALNRLGPSYVKLG